eukprot:scaffold3613_cov331-Prasinococcus_capsulatus_cf.AAC.7
MTTWACPHVCRPWLGHGSNARARHPSRGRVRGGVRVARRGSPAGACTVVAFAGGGGGGDHADPRLVASSSGRGARWTRGRGHVACYMYMERAAPTRAGGVAVVVVVILIILRMRAADGVTGRPNAAPLAVGAGGR